MGSGGTALRIPNLGSRWLNLASRPDGFPTPPGDEPHPRYSLDRKARRPQSTSGRITRVVTDNFIQNFG